MAEGPLSPITVPNLERMSRLLKSTGLRNFLLVNPYLSVNGEEADSEKVRKRIKVDREGILFKRVAHFITNETIVTMLGLEKQDFNFMPKDAAGPLSQHSFDILGTIVKPLHLVASTVPYSKFIDPALRLWARKMQERLFIKSRPSSIPRQHLLILLDIRDHPERTLGWWKWGLNRVACNDSFNGVGTKFNSVCNYLLHHSGYVKITQGQSEVAKVDERTENLQEAAPRVGREALRRKVRVTGCTVAPPAEECRDKAMPEQKMQKEDDRALLDAEVEKTTDLKSQLAEARLEIAKLIVEKDAAQAKAREGDEIAVMRARMADLASQMTVFEANKRNQQAKIDELEGAVNRWKGLAKKSESEFEEALKMFEEQREELAQQVDVLRTQQIMHNEESSSNVEALKIAECKIVALEGALTKTGRMLYDGQGRLDAEAKKMTDLKSQLAEAQLEIGKLTGEKDAAESKAREDDEMAEMRTRMVDLASHMTVLEEDKRNQQAKIDELEGAVNRWKGLAKKSESEFEEALKMFEEQREELAQQVDVLRTQQIMHREESSSNVEALKIAECKIVSLEGALTKTGRMLYDGQGRLDAEAKKMTDLKSKLAEAQLEIGKLTGEKDAAEAKAREGHDEIAVMRTRMADLDSQMIVFEANKRNQQSKIDELDGAVNHWKGLAELTSYGARHGAPEQREHHLPNKSKKRKMEFSRSLQVSEEEFDIPIVAEVVQSRDEEFGQEEEELQGENEAWEVMDDQLTRVQAEIRIFLTNARQTLVGNGPPVDWFYEVNAAVIEILKVSMGYAQQQLKSEQWNKFWEGLPIEARGHIPRMLCDGRIEVENLVMCNILAGGLQNFQGQLIGSNAYSTPTVERVGVPQHVSS